MNEQLEALQDTIEDANENLDKLERYYYAICNAIHVSGMWFESEFVEEQEALLSRMKQWIDKETKRIIAMEQEASDLEAKLAAGD